MSVAAKIFWLANGDVPVSREKALMVLDAAAEYYRGADAEFDDEMTTITPLSRLVCVAFDANPQMVAGLKDGFDDEGDWDAWYEGPYRKFSDRYGFC